MVLNWKNTIIRIINMFNMSLISFLKIDQIYDTFETNISYLLQFLNSLITLNDQFKQNWHVRISR